jgi:hypothetical protein
MSMGTRGLMRRAERGRSSDFAEVCPAPYVALEDTCQCVEFGSLVNIVRENLLKQYFDAFESRLLF